MSFLAPALTPWFEFSFQKSKTEPYRSYLFMDQSEWTTDPGLRQRNWSGFPFCSVSLVARQLSPPPIHTTSPGMETQVPTALRNLCWRKKINKWINLSNKWISINDHSNNTDMSKGRLLFLSNFPLKTWLWKHCILCLQSYSRYFNSFESKAKKLSTNKTNWIGLPSRSLSNPYVVRCP